MARDARARETRPAMARDTRARETRARAVIATTIKPGNQEAP